MRLYAKNQCLREIIKSGIIGEVFLLKIGVYDYIHRDDWQAFKKYGGGMINNYGAHQIDAALYITESTVSKISASMFSIASAGDADDVVKMLLHTKNNVALDIEINMASALNLPGTAVYGKYGTIVFHQDNAINGKTSNYFKARYFEPCKQNRVEASDSLAAKDRLYISTQPSEWIEKDFTFEENDKCDYYNECYKYFALDEKPFVPIEDTMEVMRVIDECRKYAGWSQD